MDSAREARILRKVLGSVLLEGVFSEGVFSEAVFSEVGLTPSLQKGFPHPVLRKGSHLLSESTTRLRMCPRLHMAWSVVSKEGVVAFE